MALDDIDPPTSKRGGDKADPLAGRPALPIPPCVPSSAATTGITQGTVWGKWS